MQTFPKMINRKFKDTQRIIETSDGYDHINNSVYYLISDRAESKCDIPELETVTPNNLFVLVESSYHYKNQLFSGDNIDVETTIEQIGEDFLIINQEMERKKGKYPGRIASIVKRHARLREGQFHYKPGRRTCFHKRFEEARDAVMKQNLLSYDRLLEDNLALLVVKSDYKYPLLESNPEKPLTMHASLDYDPQNPLKILSKMEIKDSNGLKVAVLDSTNAFCHARKDPNNGHYQFSMPLSLRNRIADSFPRLEERLEAYNNERIPDVFNSKS